MTFHNLEKHSRNTLFRFIFGAVPFFVVFTILFLSFLHFSSTAWATDPQPVINEAMVNPDTTSLDGWKNEKWVEIYNPSLLAKDISSWCLHNASDPMNSYEGKLIATGTTILAKGFLALKKSVTGFDPSYAGGVIRLYSAYVNDYSLGFKQIRCVASSLVHELSYSNYGHAGKSVGLSTNGGSTVVEFDIPTPGESNEPDSVSPTAALIFEGTGPSYPRFKVAFSEDVVKSEAENPANYFLENWPGEGGSGDLIGDATVSYDATTFTATVSFISAGWYLSAEQEWGVQNVHDIAGNMLSPNPTSGTSTPMQNPTVTINFPLTGNYGPSTWASSVSGTSYDPAVGSGVTKVEVKIGFGLYITASGTSSWSYSFTPSVDGDYTIYAKATDKAGNAGEQSVSFTWDGKNPFDPTTISSPSHSVSTWSADNTVDVSWSGADGTGSPVAGYSILWDKVSDTIPDDSVDTTSASDTSSALADGSSYYFHLRTKDIAGNWSGGANFGPFFVDKTAPLVPTLDFPSADATINDTTPTLKWFSSSDTGSGIKGYEVYLNDAKVSGGSLLGVLEFTVTGTLAEGDYSWYIAAFDNVGLSTKSAFRSFTIDLVIPSSIIILPKNTVSDSTVYINSWDGIVAGTASDNTEDGGLSKVEISIQKDSNKYFWNGTTWISSASEILLLPSTLNGYINWSYSLTNPTADETYILKSHATDLAGNSESTYKLTVVYDKTIPQVALAIDPASPDGDNSWYVTKPKVTLTASDANFEKIEYQIDSQTGTWLLYSSAVTIKEGTHKFYYRVWDKADNVSETGLKNVKVDLTRPGDVGDLRAEAGDEEVTLEWDASLSEDTDHYTIYKSEDKNFIPNPETELAEVSEGTRSYDDTKVDNDTKYYYYIIAFDTSGNTSDAKGVSVTLSVESPETETLPTLPITPGTVEGAQTTESGGMETGGQAVGSTVGGESQGEVKGEEVSEEVQQEAGETGAGGILGVIDRFWWLLLFFIPFSIALWYRKKV